MYSLTNSVVNSSSHDVWFVYSVGDKDGDGWDEWRVRLIRSGSQSKYVVDLDYMKPRSDSAYIRNKYGWWKLGQGKNYGLYNSDNDPNEIIVICFGGYIPFVSDLRYYSDWASGKGKSEDQIKAQIREWESLQDASSPIEAED
jgi:hypothetical protein